MRRTTKLLTAAVLLSGGIAAYITSIFTAWPRVGDLASTLFGLATLVLVWIVLGDTPRPPRTPRQPR
jgi:hypothetical protein